MAMLIGLLGLSASAQMQQGQQQMSEEDMQAMMQQMAQQMQPVSSGEYENTDLGFGVLVPEGYSGMQVQQALTVVEGDIQQMMTQQGDPPYSFSVIAAPKDPSGPASVQAADLDEVANQIAASVASQPNVQQEIVSQKKTEVNGEPCLHMVINIDVEGSELQTQNYIFITDAKVFYVSYTYMRNKTEQYAGRIADHVLTFRIL